MEALKPLYLARVVSFIRETLELSHESSEEKIVRQAQIFHRYRRAITHKLRAARRPSDQKGNFRGQREGLGDEPSWYTPIQ